MQASYPRPGAWLRSFSDALFHQAIIDAHQLRIVVILENQLSRPQLCFLTQQNLGAQLPLQFFERRANVRVRMYFARSAAAVARAARRQAFDLPYGQAAACGALSVAHAQLRVRDRQQRAAVTSAELSLFNPVLNRWFQF